MPFERVGELDQLWDGEMVSCSAGGRRILLIRIGEAIRAFEDRCVHLGVALSEGLLDGKVITCSAHQYQYDALTGRGINPRAVCLIRFPVRIDGASILVDPAAGYREADQPLEGSHG